MPARGGKRKTTVRVEQPPAPQTPAQRRAETRRRNKEAQEQADRELVEQTGQFYPSRHLSVVIDIASQAGQTRSARLKSQENPGEHIPSHLIRFRLPNYYTFPAWLRDTPGRKRAASSTSRTAVPPAASKKSKTSQASAPTAAQPKRLSSKPAGPRTPRRGMAFE